MVKKLHRNIRKPPRDRLLVTAGLWMIVANTVLFGLWRFGFVPVSQHILFILLSILGGAAIGTMLVAIRRVPRIRQGGA